MAKLTTKARAAIPKSQFGLPAQKKYPMPDKSHAANAKARATQQVKKGNLSKSQAKVIDRKADKVLGEKT
jgi:ABC-type thiamine transport system substrate-binding protein